MIYSRPDFNPRHLVTKGNYNFVATGTALYTVIKKGDKFKKVYNVAPGQPVMWAADAVGTTPPTTIRPADLTVNHLPNLRIGVGISTEKNGITDAIRLLTPGNLEGCTIDQLDAFAPQCATPHIKAIYPECVPCNTITAKVKIYDNDSISFSDNALKAYHEFTASYTPDCSSCDDCPAATTTCDEVVCGLVDALNNDTDFRINGESYPHYYNTGVERPYKAFKIWDTWKSYCISPEVGEGCTECNSIEALTTFTINDVTTPFNLVNPADNTKTLIDQLELAVDIINQKFEETIGKHGGFAFLSRGQGNCCPLQLFVTTCDEGFEIDGLLECENAIEQWPEFTKKGTCKQCGTTDQTETPSCGIGIFTRPDIEDCDCFKLNQPRQFYDRWILGFDIISGSGNDKTPRYSRQAELLVPQRASGFGSQIQYLEFANNIDAIGEEGFDYDIGNDIEGWLDLPRDSSRLRNAITADCEKSYCSYKFRSRAKTEFGFTKTPVNKLIESYIHVPENDNTTKTAVEALFDKLVDLVPTTCTVLTSAEC
jgi:hypothetical protein